MKYKLPISKTELKLPPNTLWTPIRWGAPFKDRNGYDVRTVYCSCKCGNTRTIRLNTLLNGTSVSCGCLMRKKASERFSKYPTLLKIKHQEGRYSLRACYYSMIDRCENKKCKAYPYYGGRGVTVCNEWRKDPDSFFKWALNNGWKKGLCLDKDKIGGGLLYSPKTCCFITHKENSNNTRSNIIVVYMGEKMTITELSEKTMVTRHMLYNRIINLGWDVDRAVTTKRNDDFLSKKYRTA